MEKFKKIIGENWILIVAIIYLLIPVDIVPDFIPLLGKLDDSSILILDLIKRIIDSRKVNE